VFERFTDRARRVLVLAQEEARLLDHNFIGPEHLLIGLIHEGDGLAARALESLGISLEGVRTEVEKAIDRRGDPSNNRPPRLSSTFGRREMPRRGVPAPPTTPQAKKVLELSLRAALQLGHNYIGTEHLLLGVVAEGDSVATDALVSLRADPRRVREEVISLLGGYGSHVNATEERRPARRAAWPTEAVRYPIRLVPGPRDPFLIQGLECRIVGLLIFEEDFEIVWTVAGDHDVLWSKLGVLEDDDHPPVGTTPRWMTVVEDDVGTVYETDSRVFTRSPSRWSGHVSCRPAPPAEARLLRLTWIDRSVEMQL
jgi:hypothetical protein